MSKLRLKDAVIAITYRCNSKCRMCNIWQIKDHDGEIKPSDLLRLPETLRSVNVTGGDPFLRPDLEEIIKTITERCPEANIILSSNGFATDLIASQMEKIIKISPNIGVALSLDGIGKKHAEVRGIEKAYEKVLATVEKLKKLGVKHLKISFTLSDYNAGELPKVYALAKKLGLEFSLTIIHSSENYFSKENIIRDKSEMLEQLDWLIEKELSLWHPKSWARAYFAYGAKKFIETGKRILPDYSGKANIFIDPRGNIYPCNVSNDPMGHISEMDNLKSLDEDQSCQASWMVCTAREAIKKHWFKTILWIIPNKLKSFVR